MTALPRILAALAIAISLAGGFSVQPVANAAGINHLCQPVSSQSWWSQPGITVPTVNGEHVHMDTCLPTGIVSGMLNLPITISQHDGTGPIRWVRACRQSTYCQTWNLSPYLGPCADCSRSMTIPINLNNWPTGKQELRLTANVSVNGDGNRAFQSTGWPLNVRSSTCSERCTVFWEARGWYSGHGYANARLSSSPSALGSGATISVRLGPGSGGQPTKFAGVYVDPAFHDGSAGIVVRQWSGPFTGSVTLPTLAAGPHRLVLLSSDGANAGVLAIPFVVP